MARTTTSSTPAARCSRTATPTAVRLTPSGASALGNVAPGATGGLNPTTAIFDISDNGGYWVADALGKVFTFGDALGDIDMSRTHLNGPLDRTDLHDGVFGLLTRKHPILSVRASSRWRASGG